MTPKRLIAIQVILLVLTLLAGFMLTGDLSSGPRMIHRSLGMLSALTSLVVVLMAIRHQLPLMQKVLAGKALLFNLLAGFFGMSLKTTMHYDMFYMGMRISGVIALLAAIILLVQVSKEKQS